MSCGPLRPPKPVNLGDIQGNVVRPYDFDVATHLFVRFTDAGAGRSWVKELDVKTAKVWDHGTKPESATLNLAFTAAGLRALGLPEATLDTFSLEFRQGMAASAEDLADHPGLWEEPWRPGRVHAMVAQHARSRQRLDEGVDATQAAMAARGVELVGRQDAARIRDPDGKTVREHFGFSDGFGQPQLDLAGGGEQFRGQGTPVGRNEWKPVALGEFLLGHYDEEGILPDAPQPAALATNGTYLVYRKLRQDVEAFNRYTTDRGRELGWDAAKVAAAMVGRWPDGTPLELRQDGPDARVGPVEAKNNDFRYRRDLNGHRCPVGAHIRRTNPRDALQLSEQLTSRHRMIRRGITYDDRSPDGGGDRGLLFMAVVASLKRQFEFVQGQWVNNGNSLHLGDDRDPVCGANDGSSSKMTIQGRPPRFLAGIPQFVTMRGGEYFFKPGIAALDWLAKAGWA